MIGGKAPFHLPGTGRNCQGSAAGGNDSKPVLVDRNESLPGRAPQNQERFLTFVRPCETRSEPFDWAQGERINTWILAKRSCTVMSAVKPWT